MKVNGEIINKVNRAAAGLMNPKMADWIEVNRKWEEGDHLTLAFPTPIEVYHPDEMVTSVRGKIVLTRGPLVYCLESVDNPEVDIFNVELDPDTIRTQFIKGLLGGIWAIKAFSTKGELLTFIPYYLWGNRGASSMTVFLLMKEKE